MTSHVFRPLVPLALVFALIALCHAAAHAFDSSNASNSYNYHQPHGYRTNPPPTHPSYGLQTPDTQGSGSSTEPYGNPLYPSQEQNTSPPVFSNPPSRLSAPEASRPWDYHTPSRGCFGERC